MYKILPSYGLSTIIYLILHSLILYIRGIEDSWSHAILCRTVQWWSYHFGPTEYLFAGVCYLVVRRAVGIGMLYWNATFGKESPAVFLWNLYCSTIWSQLPYIELTRGPYHCPKTLFHSWNYKCFIPSKPLLPNVEFVSKTNSAQIVVLHSMSI